MRNERRNRQNQRMLRRKICYSCMGGQSTSYCNSEIPDSPSTHPYVAKSYKLAEETHKLIRRRVGSGRQQEKNTGRGTVKHKKHLLVNISQSDRARIKR
jgi:hypothetical protein